MSQFYGSINNNQIEEDADAEITAAERLKATRLVCSQSEDSEEARIFLGMLGLLPDQEPATVSSAVSFGKEFS